MYKKILLSFTLLAITVVSFADNFCPPAKMVHFNPVTQTWSSIDGWVDTGSSSKHALPLNFQLATWVANAHAPYGHITCFYEAGSVHVLLENDHFKQVTPPQGSMWWSPLEGIFYCSGNSSPYNCSL